MRARKDGGAVHCKSSCAKTLGPIGLRPRGALPAAPVNRVPAACAGGQMESGDAKTRLPQRLHCSGRIGRQQKGTAAVHARIGRVRPIVNAPFFPALHYLHSTHLCLARLGPGCITHPPLPCEARSQEPHLAQCCSTSIQRVSSRPSGRLDKSHVPVIVATDMLRRDKLRGFFPNKSR